MIIYCVLLIRQFLQIQVDSQENSKPFPEKLKTKQDTKLEGA